MTAVMRNVAAAAMLLGLSWVQSLLCHRSAVVDIGLPAQQKYWGEYLNTKMANRFLGTRIVIADLIWLDLLYKSDVRRESDFSPFYKVLKVILGLDPKNYMGVWFGGVYLSVIKDDIKGASQLFKDAVDALERDLWVPEQLKGSIYFAYGYHLLYEEHDAKRAGEYLMKCSQMNGAPPLAKQMAQTLSTERGQLELGFRVLNDFYRRVTTVKEKENIELKMRTLLIRRELLDLNEQYEQYRLRSEASALPRSKSLQLFLRSINHKGFDFNGKKLILDQSGRIQMQETTQ